MSGYPVLKGLLQSTQNYTWNTADAVGRGATAIVYLGREKRTGQVVAVKVFHEHLRINHRREDVPELELLRRLKHENIISLHAVEQELQTKRTVLVTEYCEGGSLHSMLEQAPYQYGLPEKEFMLVLFHTVAGIKYLRHAGVVHRDIKPANIMRYITEDGSSVFKLTDFGAARDLSEDENFTSMYGTEEYLHPGMYKTGVLRVPTGQHFDASVDLWSLGVTFYHVATGQLPFQPYGGRNNKKTMYHIISQKESGVISGQQHFEGGPVLWSRELPATCLLSSGLRQVMTPVLAGLVEANPAKMMTYEELFGTVQMLKSLVKISVFHYTQATLHTLLVKPSATLSGLQEAITSITDQSASQQLLIFSGRALEDTVDPMTPVAAYPTYVKSATIYLFPKESMAAEAPRLSSPEIPPFPEFLNIVDYNKDGTLAFNCLARGHLIKQHTELVSRQQACLVEGHFFLRMYCEGRLRATGEALEQIQQQVAQSKKRFDMFYAGIKSFQSLLIALHGQPDTYFRDVLKDDTLLKVHTKAEERVEEIRHYRKGLQEKLDDLRSQASQWADQCNQSCVGKVDHQLTVISRIQSRFRRDKSVKNEMTSHDEAIHHYERQKLQELCTRMLSLLTGHCIPTRDQLHKQAFQFAGLLIKTLNRVVKVEKNNESVVNCQQLLSSRLDKEEKKCQDEIEHIQKHHKLNQQPQKKQQSASVDDEGLGPSVSALTSPSKSAVTKTTFSHRVALCGQQAEAVGGQPWASSSEPTSFKTSLQSLRRESEEVLSLIKENMDIMKRLEEEAPPMASSGSLSRLMPSRLS